MPVQPDLIARGLGALPSEVGLGSASARYRVYIRDADYQRVAELTEWISFSCVAWFNDVGTWQLECSSQTIEAELLTKDAGIIVTRELEGVEKTVFSGFVWTEWGYTETTFRAAGYSDEALLWTPARPDPELAGPPFASDYDVRTGVASTVMMALVNNNIGPIAAPAPWAISALRFIDDPLLGSTITARANLQPLITLLAELALTPYAGGLGFYLRQSDVVTNRVEFGVYAPPDRSADAKFSVELGTVAQYEDIASAPEANHVYVMGGDGFGANRTVIAEQDDDSISEWGRVISTVVDMRGTTDTGELNQRAAEAIAGVATMRRTAITPFDVPSLQYGRDYDLGTLVTVVTRSGERTELIRQVEINLDPERGATITPIVGQGDGTDDERTATIVRSIQGRVSNIERNWNVPDESIIRAMLVDVLKPPIAQVVAFAGVSLPDGWLWCDGSAVSRTTYALLFAALGTSWGSGDGSTTFNLPNVEDRVILGAGNLYALADTGGSASVNFAHTHAGGTLAYAHTHSTPDHAHPHTHTTPAHAHSHTHTGPSHSHAGPAHTHTTDINHDHGAFTSGFQAGATVVVGATAPGAGTWDHQHTIDPPALGSSVITSSSSGTGDTGLGGTGATGSALDSASSGSGTSGSALDTAASGAGTTGGAGSTSWSGASGSSLTTTSLLPPYVAMPAIIYAGV